MDYCSRNSKTGNIRVYLFETRTEDDMKLFINSHIKPNNNIITDGWATYGFLDFPISNYIHKTYIHGPNGIFGYGEYSTSHIKGLWGTLKSYIKRIYNIIFDDNFVLFLRKN